MHKYNKYLFLLFILIMPFIVNAAKCDYSKRSEVRKLAGNITISYEIVENNNDKYVDIVISNLIDSLSIGYTITNNDTNRIVSTINTVNYSDTADGVYHIKHTSIDNVYKYSFSINTVDSFGCGDNKLKTITLTIPKYNSFSEIDECRYTYTKDYIYCKPWITTSSDLNEATVLDRIKKYKSQVEKTNTTSTYVVVNTEEEDNYERLMKLRQYAIIGISIGIGVDLIFIVILAIRLKEYMKFDI